MAAEVETLTVGPLDVNCYIAGCGEHRACAVVDPGDSAKRILDVVGKKGWSVTQIINTHGHADHTGANAQIKEATGAPLSIHKDDAEMLTHPDMADMAAYLGLKPSIPADRKLADGDVIKICDCVELKVLGTPGHSRGGVCLVHDNFVITGDTLFRMSIGRSDLAGGDHETLMNSIKTRVMALPDDMTVYPGHGEPSTVGFERRYNPFLAGFM